MAFNGQKRQQLQIKLGQIGYFWSEIPKTVFETFLAQLGPILEVEASDAPPHTQKVVKNKAHRKRVKRSQASRKLTFSIY